MRALARHDEAGGDFERARTALLYGKWLRRRRRPREARDRLGTALAGFERCGAGVWAEQARGELRALGAASHGSAPARLTRLTPQQLRIARHVAEGATNREVALTLAVSTRTVDYHLRKVFAALGVRSRLSWRAWSNRRNRGNAPKRPVHNPRDRPDGMPSFGAGRVRGQAGRGRTARGGSPP